MQHQMQGPQVHYPGHHNHTELSVHDQPGEDDDNDHDDAESGDGLSLATGSAGSLAYSFDGLLGDELQQQFEAYIGKSNKPSSREKTRSALVQIMGDLKARGVWVLPTTKEELDHLLTVHDADFEAAAKRGRCRVAVKRIKSFASEKKLPRACHILSQEDTRAYVEWIKAKHVATGSTIDQLRLIVNSIVAHVLGQLQRDITIMSVREILDLYRKHPELFVVAIRNQSYSNPPGKWARFLEFAQSQFPSCGREDGDAKCDMRTNNAVGAVVKVENEENSKSLLPPFHQLLVQGEGKGVKVKQEGHGEKGVRSEQQEVDVVCSDESDDGSTHARVKNEPAAGDGAVQKAGPWDVDVMAPSVREGFIAWLQQPGRGLRKHQATAHAETVTMVLREFMRRLKLPPRALERLEILGVWGLRKHLTLPAAESEDANAWNLLTEYLGGCDFITKPPSELVGVKRVMPYSPASHTHAAAAASPTAKRTCVAPACMTSAESAGPTRQQSPTCRGYDSGNESWRLSLTGSSGNVGYASQLFMLPQVISQMSYASGQPLYRAGKAAATGGSGDGNGRLGALSAAAMMQPRPSEAEHQERDE